MISFGSAKGNLFDVIGRLGTLVKNVSAYQSTQYSTFTNSLGAIAQLENEPDIQSVIGSSYISQLNSPGTSIGGLVRQVAASALSRAVFRDNPLPNQTLTTINVFDSLVELIRQMRLAGATVLSPTISATKTSFTGSGNGVINYSTKRPEDCLTLENAFAEDITFKCSADSYLSGATLGNETFSVYGVGSQDDMFASNWPLGSNCNITLSAIDGSADNSSGNILTNSGFDDFTSNVPDKWSLVTGTAGTNVFQESSITYDLPPNKALRFLGDGSTLQEIRQRFGNSSGTLGTLEPITQYSFNLFMRRDAVAIGAGVLEISLVDGNLNPIQDEGSVNNLFTIDLTTLTTSYASISWVFRTPIIMPSTYYLRVRFTTALSSGRSVYLDKLSLGEMSQTYKAGLYVAVHAGSNAFEVGDFATLSVSNSRGAAGTLNTFQTLFSRLFVNEMYGSGLLLPSSPVNTISDGLIG